MKNLFVKFSQLFIIAAIVAVSTSLAPQVAQATTVSSTINVPTTLYYYGTQFNGVTGWGQALSNAYAQINYGVNVFDAGSGATINSGDTVTVGQNIVFQFYQHTPSDAYWNGTGFSNDSPYGSWTSGGYSPPMDSSGNVDCKVNDYLNKSGLFKVYIPLIVKNPTESLTGTSGMSCSAPVDYGAYGVQENCTITSPGAISPTFNFGATQGQFYYRWVNTDSSAGNFGDCNGNNTPLGSTNASGNTYVLPVPAKSVPFSLTAVSNNNNPNAPTITGPTTGTTGTAYTFNVHATDPDGDTIDYGLDSTKNGSVDAYLPLWGWVASGTIEPWTHTWNTPGTYSFQALTRDVNGGSSGWGPAHTIVISDPPPPPAVPTLTCPASVQSGDAPTLTWSSTNATSCTGTGFSTGGATSGSDVASTITTAHNYSISCTGPGGTGTDSCTVAVVKPTGWITASPNPCIIARGATTCTTNISWNTTGSTNAQVWIKPNPGSSLYTNNGGDLDFGNATPGYTNDAAPWIPASPDYVDFNLYDYTSGTRGALLDTVRVTGNVTSPMPTPTITGPTVGKVGTVYNFTVDSVYSDARDPYTHTALRPTQSPKDIFSKLLTLFSPSRVFAQTSSSPTIRYGIDSDGNGSSVPNLWLPQGTGTTTTYVAGGTAEPWSNKWNTTGTATFRAVIEDSTGARSVWATHTIVISGTPDLTAATGPAISASAGQTATLSGTVNNVGTDTTGASFKANLVVFAADKTTVVDNNVVTVSTMGAGGSQAVSSQSFTFPSTGTYYYQLRADSDASGAGTIAESNENNNWGGFSAITVTAPDLTPGTAPTVTVTVGQAVTVTGTAKNIGDGSTVTGFNDMFVTNLNAQGTAWNTLQTATPASPALQPGGTSSFSTTFPASNFPTAGNYPYSYCSDYDSGWNQSIVESNENNNCVSGMIVVNPTPITGTCDVSPTSGYAGQPYTWTAANIAGGVGGYTYSWSGTDNLSGTGKSAKITYLTAGTKTASVVVSSGSQSTTIDCATSPTGGSGGTIIIQSCTPTLTAPSPDPVDLGATTNIPWSVPSASCPTSCVFSDTHAVSGTSGTYAATPPKPTAPGTTDSYSLTCGTFTSNVVSVTVNVPKANISVLRDRVRKGDPTTVNWTSSDVDTCQITRSPTAATWPKNVTANASTHQANGSAASGVITTQTTFTITCVNNAGGGASDTAKAVVNVVPDFQEF
jgi:hypothetical protein